MEFNFHFSGRVEIDHRVQGNPAQDNLVLQWLRSIHQLQGAIMSKISEFAERVEAHNKRVDEHFDGIKTDNTELKRLITELQNSPGEVTPGDQVLLDQVEARIKGQADKMQALDDETPPPAPPAPPV